MGEGWTWHDPRALVLKHECASGLPKSLMKTQIMGPPPSMQLSGVGPGEHVFLTSRRVMLMPRVQGSQHRVFSLNTSPFLLNAHHEQS